MLGSAVCRRIPSMRVLRMTFQAANRGRGGTCRRFVVNARGPPCTNSLYVYDVYANAFNDPFNARYHSSKTYLRMIRVYRRSVSDLRGRLKLRNNNAAREI